MVPSDSTPDFAVLMDASAIFFAVRDLFDGLQLDYSKLTNLVAQKTGSTPPLQTTKSRSGNAGLVKSDVEKGSGSGNNLRSRSGPDGRVGSTSGPVWAMWTSFHAQNTGQARFLEFAENTLGWAVRRVDPSDSYIVDPQTTLGISKSSDGGSNRAVNRLIRFDASIAYSIGRIAATHQIVLISDSYTLAEPLVRSAVARNGKNFIAFFGRLLDSRWLGLLRGNAAKHIEFIDLDESADELFGSKPKPSMSAWEGDFPIR